MADSSIIMQVWVIKRHLDSFANPFHIRSLSHSGLMVRTVKGDEFVLEYMADGRAHLYKAEYGVDKDKVKDVTDFIRMRDEMGMEWSWVMEAHGHFMPKDVKCTPDQAKKKLQELMGRDYDHVRENPHTAQEQLRKFWKLEVTNKYVEEGFDTPEEEEAQDES